jgi:hypothetical protein
MVVVPLVEMRMQYMTLVSEIWMLVAMWGEEEGWERKHEPSRNFLRTVWCVMSKGEGEGW